VVEFCWKPDTIAAFLDGFESKTMTSTLVKASYEDDDGDIDELKFRLQFNPAEEEDDVAGESPPGPKPPARQRLCMQLVGGKSSTGVYQLSFHSVHPLFQIHLAVDDHRRPLVETEQFFHRLHPLWAALQSAADPTLRCLVRMKPLNSAEGRLQNMCGCC
jgi:hypothetical protein